MKEIELDTWADLDRVLRMEFEGKTVLIRNFSLVVFDDLALQIEVDQVEIVRKTGTDRRENSNMWNVPGFDYDHDRAPKGKRPNEIIYAYWTDLDVVSVSDGRGNCSNKAVDLTANLSEHDGIIVYDSSMLFRAAPNEYWFIEDPQKAALLLVTLKG